MTDNIIIQGKNGIYAKVLRHSKSIVSGTELLTIEGSFPRFVLPELQTHRMLFLRDMISKNLQSSRAVPADKMLNEVRDNPVVPVFFGKNKAGMVADFEVEDTDLARQLWLDAAHDAYTNAVQMKSQNMHKQLVNRVLEPYVMSKAVISATDWNNLFWLRIHADAQPEVREFVSCIYKVKQASKPMLIDHGEWHVPYVHVDRNAHGEIRYFNDKGNIISADQAKKISSSCNAQVSYRLLNTSEEKAEDIHKKLIGSVPGHWSPLDNVATPMSNFTWWKRKLASKLINDDICLYRGNLCGFESYRKTFKMENMQMEFVEK